MLLIGAWLLKVCHCYWLFKFSNLDVWFFASWVHLTWLYYKTLLLCFNFVCTIVDCYILVSFPLFMIGFHCWAQPVFPDQWMDVVWSWQFLCYTAGKGVEKLVGDAQVCLSWNIWYLNSYAITLALFNWSCSWMIRLQ